MLEKLYARVTERAKHDPEVSYSAQLLHKGTSAISQKLSEEATETVIAALVQDKEAVCNEVGDLLYHLAVLLYDQNITPEELQETLNKREDQSGIAEKNSRSE